ncbi:hypothetical protein ACSV9I_15055 [Rhizobium sp. G187]|nr:hypothetical protein [Rhizobium sp. AAP43]
MTIVEYGLFWINLGQASVICHRRLMGTAKWPAIAFLQQGQGQKRLNT